tara:strand:+ start:835 stop:1503 length:669 start_codon:yes stop_codon:yes gene_type:complete
MDTSDIEVMSQWFELCYDTGIQLEPATEMGQRIVNAYCGLQRHYHTLEHINHCLSVFDQIPDEIEDHNELRFAIWFHDFVYNPKSETNEDESAEIAFNWLQNLGVANPDLVRGLIQSTENYLQQPREGFTYRIMHDIDLAILGSEEIIYIQYENGIRAEFNHLTDREFFPAREEFLRNILERQPLFTLDIFVLQWEEKARQNIEKELERIKRVRILFPPIGE